MIELWDILLPAIYMILDLILPPIEHLITVLFGTPDLQCIIAEILTIIFESLDHVLIGFQKVIYGAERGMQIPIQQRAMNTVRPFIREFYAVKTGIDPTVLLKKATYVPPTVSVDSDTPDPNPGTDGTCPSQSPVLSFVLPAILAVIDITSTILAYLAPMIVIFLRITVMSLIQLLPQFLNAVGQVLQALTTNGVFGDFFNVLKDIISLIGPAWNAVCPIIAFAMWLGCTFQQVFQGLVGFILGKLRNVVGKIICGVAGLFYKRDISSLNLFTENPEDVDPLAIHYFDKVHSQNYAKFNILFSRRGVDRSNTVTNHMNLMRKHGSYHRHTIFRPSNKKLFAIENERMPKRPMTFSDHKKLYAKQLSGLSMTAETRFMARDITQKIGNSFTQFIPSLHQRTYSDAVMTIGMSFDIINNVIGTEHGVSGANNVLLVQMYMQRERDSSLIFGSTSSRRTTDACTGPNQDQETYGTDDDDNIVYGTSTGGIQNQVAGTTINSDNTAGRCKSVYSMCQCTSGSVGTPGQSDWQEFKSVGQCVVNNLKDMFSNLLTYIEDVIKAEIALLKALPQILRSLLEFAKELTEDVAQWLDEIIVNESPLINSLFNALFMIGGMGSAIESLNFTSYKQSYPQQQDLSTVNLMATPEMQCPETFNMTEKFNNPSCPEYHCVQNNDPSLCVFPNQDYPGKPDTSNTVPSPTYEVTNEPMTLEEYDSLSLSDKMRVKDFYKTPTVRRGRFTRPLKTSGRLEFQALHAMYRNKGPSSYGSLSQAWKQLTDQYALVMDYSYRLNDMGLFSSASSFQDAGGHAYSYDPNNILAVPVSPTPTPTPVPPPPFSPPSPPPSPPPSDSCRADAANPYKCCTANSTAYECCRGLIGCIPAIPPGFKLKPWNGLVWLGNITESTCSPFTFGYTGFFFPLNGLKEVLFLLRLVFGEFVYYFIKDSPTSYVRAFWQFWLGWLVFPRNQLPPFALVCFSLNLGGLLALSFIFVVFFLFYDAFEEYFADLADIFTAFKLQSEVDDDLQNQIPTQNLLTISPTNTLFRRPRNAKRTASMRMAIRRAIQHTANAA